MIIQPRRFEVTECTHTGPNRCAVTTCRYSLRADWAKRGGLPAWAPACALEVAQAAEAVGGFTLGEVAVVLGDVSRERVRQIEEQALHKLSRRVQRVQVE